LFLQRRLGSIGFSRASITEIKSSIPKWKEYGVYVFISFHSDHYDMVAKTEYTDYFMWTIGPLTLIYLFYEMTKVTASERKKLWAALVFIIFSIFFWGIYEQSGGSLSIFAAKTLIKTFWIGSKWC
jgi:POT family proton-dependent oligopeptide transporter